MLHPIAAALAAAAILLAAAPQAHAASCTGSPSCRVCTNCRNCKHCKAGGTCGVCAPAARQPAAEQPPAEYPPARRQPATPTPAPRPRPVVPQPRPDPTPAAPAADPDIAAAEGGVTLYFSPGGGCQDAIVERVDAATLNVRVQAYRLTAVPIVKALIDAHRRGVKVHVILDGSQQSPKYSDATPLHNAGIPVLIDGAHAIAHNKIVIVDGNTVLAGSYNFSAAAETRNAENLLVLERLPQIAAAYVREFEEHARHAKPYVAPTQPFDPARAGPTTTPAGGGIDGQQ